VTNRSKPGGWRIALGILTAIVTVLLTLALLPFTICFVAIAVAPNNSMSRSDANAVALLVFAQVLVPVFGLWLTVFLLRGRKLAPGARGVGTGGLQPMMIPGAAPRVPLAFSEEAFNWMRGLIGAYIGLLILERIGNAIVPQSWVAAYYLGFLSLFSFAFYLAPWIFILARSARAPEKYATMLAVAFAPASACWSFYTVVRYWLFYRRNLVNAGETLLDAILEVVIAVVAWRVLRSLADWSETVLATFFAASLFYFYLTVQLTTVLLTRLHR
jgi:hypothetical protein